MIDKIFGFLIPAMIGFAGGVFFGIVTMALMAASSNDSRYREEMEEKNNDNTGNL